ncbi:beta-1,3-galactosyltransferase [Aphelenchoides avenae]|nr:beta-1,3-galactosyltransferase [Aphelenchus avenae]
MSRPPDPTVCTDKTLFIGVGTGPKSFDRRSSIRRLRAAELPDTAIMRFFVGLTERATYAKLKEEERRFGDIVFCDLPDGYDNLYLKASHDVHAMMQWQQRFCPQAAFLLKTDDDTTVHIARLKHHIASRFKPAINGTKAIFGSVKSFRWVFRERNSKRYVPGELFPDDVYPPFCTGFSYLVSSDAVSAILFGNRLVNAFTNEDALYTGVIAGKMGILRSSHADVFHNAGLLQNVTKCEGTGIPLSSAVYIHDGDPAGFRRTLCLS